jgi:hypothetical protein
MNEYPNPESRGKVPENAHEFMSYSENLRNEWMHDHAFAQLNEMPYVTRGNKPIYNKTDGLIISNDTKKVGWWSNKYPYPDKRYFDFENKGKNGKDGDYV